MADALTFDDAPSLAGGETPRYGARTRITVRPSDRELAFRTVLGEAADEPPEGQAAVAAVIRNRLQSGRFGDNLPRVVLSPNQFEPWNTQGGRSRMYGYGKDSDTYRRAEEAVNRAFDEGYDP